MAPPIRASHRGPGWTVSAARQGQAVRRQGHLHRLSYGRQRGRLTGPNLSQIGSIAARASRVWTPAYLQESIRNSQAYLVPGFPPVMPSFQGVLTDAEINAIVEYLMTRQ